MKHFYEFINEGFLKHHVDDDKGMKLLNYLSKLDFKQIADIKGVYNFLTETYIYSIVIRKSENPNDPYGEELWEDVDLKISAERFNDTPFTTTIKIDDAVIDLSRKIRREIYKSIKNIYNEIKENKRKEGVNKAVNKF